MSWSILLTAVISLLLPVIAMAGKGVVASPHNLSVSGPNQTYAFNEIRVCVFCHTPHNAQLTGAAPLWNRALPDEDQYTMYKSPNFNAKVRQASLKPTGASRVCLSCHDGTLALNSYGGAVLGSTGAARYLTGRANLTTNLSDDHPISFPYTAELSMNASLVNPAQLTGVVKLDKDGFVQCTTCHNPHENEFGNFLVMNNGDSTKPGYNASTPSPLCITCHTPSGWSTSVHNIGDGCLNCHTSHTATVAQYLLKAPVDQVCFTSGCHSSDAAHVAAEPVRFAAGAIQSLLGLISDSVFLAGNQERSRHARERGTDMKTLFNGQIYRHPIGRQQGEHDRKEKLPMRRAHVECVDCHNSHMAGGPAINVSLKTSLNGVSGISAESVVGSSVTREYEICNKCHSGAGAINSIALRRVSRMIQEPDQMKRFRASNPSLHPVTVDRRGNGDSLRGEYRASMIRIECTDCHNSDDSKKAGRNGPNGPHASRFEHILIARYDFPLGGGKNRSSCGSYITDYDLCFRCHSDNYVMVSGTYFASGGVNEHAKHVIDRCIPCAACHDPHGVSMQSGATTANNAHLINFERSYAASRSVAQPRYQSTGFGRGSCSVSCHSGGTHSYTR